MRRFLPIVLCIFMVAAPFAASAAGQLAGPPTPNSGTLTIPNPIACSDYECLVVSVIKYILGSVALLATFMFIWGGIMMISANGNADTIKRAKETLTWAVIGIIVTILSYEIVITIVQGLNKSG